MIIKKYENVTCKICDGATSIFGSCDFSKSCQGQIPLTGHAIYYHKCQNCQYIFTIDFDDWTRDDFIKNVYNEDYIKVDPEYDGTRSRNIIRWAYLGDLDRSLGIDKSMNILDYGSGKAILAEEAKNIGWDVESWDPILDPDRKFDKKFDIIGSVEVLEHTCTPYDTANEIISLLKPETGRLIFSTHTNEYVDDISYWYLAPRNGHVGMHSMKSLTLMFDKLGLEVLKLDMLEFAYIVSWKK